MASPTHAVLVELLEAHPDALAYLLELAGTPLPGPPVPTTGTRTKTFTLERRVDRAYLVGPRETPVGFVLAEVQLDDDGDKGFSWPLYVELARSRYRCEGALVVLTVSEKVRRWIARDIATPTGAYGSSRSLQPRVIALDAIDPALLLDPDRPYLAMLAVTDHAGAPDAWPVAESALDLTLDRVPPPLAAGAIDAILGMVDQALRAHLERRIMEHRGYFTEFVGVPYKQGRAEGKVEGRAEGKAEGKAEGRAEGEVKGKAESILAFLAARGIPVSDAIRERILGCSDMKTLDAWIARAAVASTAAAVVRAKPATRSPSRRAAGRARKS